MENSITLHDADILKETLEVLRYFDINFLNKIPNEFLRKMKEASINSKKEVKIDISKSLDDQNISEECKDMISLLYYRYIATSEERTELNEIWKNNEIIYQKELKEKYNSNNIFENKNITNIPKDNLQKEEYIENMPTVIEKNIFQKIIDFIKSILKK